MYYQTENKMKDLKEHWKEFVGEPSEYVPHIFIVIVFTLLTYVVGLLFYAQGV
jgi:hypothetical protein